MKLSKTKRRQQQQQQSGKPVLVTFYVAAQPRDRGGSASTAAAHALGHHHHHKQQRRRDHHHSHGGGHPDKKRERRWNDGKSQSNNRWADLLEYSRQLRALARQTAATTATVSSTPPPPPPPPPRRDSSTLAVVSVHRDDDRRQAAVTRLERAMSQQKIRQRCFGRDDDWSWKRVLLLVFPFHYRNKSRRPMRRDNSDDSEKKVSKDRRERSGFLKTLMSSFEKRWSR